MKKKIFALTLALVMCLALFAGCSSSNDNNTDSDKTTFTVGFDAEFPPYGFINEDGDYDGFDLALAKEVCNRLDWEFVAQPIDWKAKDAELSNGNIDCIWNGFTMSEDRLDSYTWSVPYVDNSIVIVVKADSGISSFADLAGKTVITQSGSSALDALESEDNAALKDSLKELVECADYNIAFMELSSGTADAIAVDIGVAAYQMSIQDGDYVMLDETLASEVYGIGFLKGNYDLMYTVQGVLLEMAKDGTMLEIAKEYEQYGLVIDSLCLID